VATSTVYLRKEGGGREGGREGGGGMREGERTGEVQWLHGIF